MKELLIYSASVAAIAVLWRNLQSDIPALKRLVSRLPQPFRKILSCGFCFTYWISFFAVIVLEPLRNFSASVRFDSQLFLSLVNFGIGWMTLAFLATTFRFAYVVLQETVHYLVHHLNQHSH